MIEKEARRRRGAMYEERVKPRREAILRRHERPVDDLDCGEHLRRSA
jgi:hypothetical protein